ncbi:tyrosine-protein kinase Yes-like isoform X2 [Corticium candelabrum]|uniref:tyrosine-protein kinase Yes-like isoform X2 n=1 Tax=Corticium candelabrum TaxID=121492 RepID=UPI002E25F475|nr:tyrosine-protein kinase Yes-like isoform X2 [Corticium candelabrum]
MGNVNVLERRNGVIFVAFASTWICFSHFLLQFAFVRGIENEQSWKDVSCTFLNGSFSCYKYVNQSETWTNASRICNTSGAHLLSISNEYENNFVHNVSSRFGGNAVWIGLRKRKDANSSYYIWSDASNVTYTNWLLGSPNRSDSNASCVVQKSGGGDWINVPCTGRYYFLCERKMNDTISYQTPSITGSSASLLPNSTTQKHLSLTSRASQSLSTSITTGTTSTLTMLQSHQPVSTLFSKAVSSSARESETSGVDAHVEGSGDATDQEQNTEFIGSTTMTVTTTAGGSSSSFTSYISISAGIGGATVLLLVCVGCMYCYQKRMAKRAVEHQRQSQESSSGANTVSNKLYGNSAVKAPTPQMDDYTYAMTKVVTQNQTDNSFSQTKHQTTLYSTVNVDKEYSDLEGDTCNNRKHDMLIKDDDDAYAEPNCFVGSASEGKKQGDDSENGYSHLDLGFSRFRTAAYWQPEKTEGKLYAQLEGKRFPQIGRHTLKTMEHLGSGEFGSVSKGLWNSVDVAIKTLNSQLPEDRTKFLREAAIMGQFHHCNIVALYGVVTVGRPLMIVIELMEKGDLRENLSQLRSESNKKALPVDTPHKLLLMAREVAAGMEYLSNKSFVHRDLATRNILLNQEGTCKIGDFGLARDLADETYYFLSSGRKIPVRWTALEALNYRKYSSSSDVWSYGVVLYELWSLAERPFGYITNNDVLDRINSGYRLPPPPGCPRALYALMIDCWNPDYHQRPLFTDIVKRLAVNDDQLLVNKENEEIIIGQLGDDLEIAEKMYNDLQQTYV